MEFEKGEIESPEEEFSIDVDSFFELLPEEEEEEEEDDESVKDSLSAMDSCSGLSFQPLPSSEDSILPMGDMAELEWVSRFVDDSYSEIPAVVFPTPTGRTTWAVAVPAKARSKRPRPVSRPWSLSGPVLLSDSSPSSSCSSSSSSSTYQANVGKEEQTCSISPSVKRARRAGPVGSEAAKRRCNHCGVDKTPQWRAGPMGPKTLCNACGVRYKSGRLLPEYRPAGSPTFVSHVHSNSHRKVLELRRRKESPPTASCGGRPTAMAETTHPYGVV